MNTKLVNLTYEIELQTGETLTLPDSIARAVGAGRWLITIAPVPDEKPELPTRSHDALLNGYSPEDEGGSGLNLWKLQETEGALAWSF